MKTLAGDRAIEWGFVRDNLPRGEGMVLDFGPMAGAHLSRDAVAKGYRVIAIGMEDLHEDDIENFVYMRQDILDTHSVVQFDWVLNASTTEHVGLGRYGDDLGEDNDLFAMAKLRDWMKPGGKQLLTIPIGIDSVVGHYHRVYGHYRLPKLLEGYRVLKQQYWVKSDDDTQWLPCSKDRALIEEPGRLPVNNMIELSYALGGFVLEG